MREIRRTAHTTIIDDICVKVYIFTWNIEYISYALCQRCLLTGHKGQVRPPGFQPDGDEF